MSRGRSPKKAIAEAKEYATELGYRLITVEPPCFPFDFMISRDHEVALVRVRRVKHRDYDTASIRAACREEIEELRKSPFTDARELWVRGPERTWHRFRVEVDQVVALHTDNEKKRETPIAGE